MTFLVLGRRKRYDCNHFRHFVLIWGHLLNSLYNQFEGLIRVVISFFRKIQNNSTRTGSYFLCGHRIWAAMDFWTFRFQNTAQTSSKIYGDSWTKSDILGNWFNGFSWNFAHALGYLCRISAFNIENRRLQFFLYFWHIFYYWAKKSLQVWFYRFFSVF